MNQCPLIIHLLIYSQYPTHKQQNSKKSHNNQQNTSNRLTMHPQIQQPASNSNPVTNLDQRLQKLQQRSQKMYDNIDSIIEKTIHAIHQCQRSIVEEQGKITDRQGVEGPESGLGADWNLWVSGLHDRLAEIKPLKNVRDQFGQFYKKLSGFGKTIQDKSVADKPQKIRHPNPFTSENLSQLQEYLSQHYLSQENYEISECLTPNPIKKQLYQQCFQLRCEILEGNFDGAAEWIDKNSSIRVREDDIGYEIHKMKIISLVKKGKADEAFAYLREHLSQYAAKFGNQISKLMNYVITQGPAYWGTQNQYSGIYRNRYDRFNTVSLEQLAQKFVKLYLQASKIYLTHPIFDCHQVGLRYRQQFMQNLKFMPQSTQIPAHMPFAIKTHDTIKYHSYFFCPINKQVFLPTDKNVVLMCGHMVSNQAISKITEGKDTRRKMKCPICQSDQVIDSTMKVQF